MIISSQYRIGKMDHIHSRSITEKKKKFYVDKALIMKSKENKNIITLTNFDPVIYGSIFHQQYGITN